MRRLFGVTLPALLASAAPAQAQAPAALVTGVALSDYGVERAADVVWGRVAVVHAPAGPFLQVGFLTSSPPPAASGEPEAPLEGPAGPSRPPDEIPPRASEPLWAALWVWNTASLLEDEEARATFLDFVEAQGIDRVFLQLTPAAGLRPEAGFVPFDSRATGALVGELSRRGVRTYALDGDPEYARPSNHAGVVRTVMRVAEHNRAAPPEERFLGVRYDVEPYLLPGFQGPRRGEILRDWVGLLEVLDAAARRGDLVLGVDIPFWLDGRDEVTGEPFEVDLSNGRTVPVLTRVLELVDDVSVMAYRTSAAGPDGVIGQAGGELERAGSLGVDLLVGVETTLLPDEERFTVRGRGRSGPPPDLGAAWVVVHEVGDGRADVWLVQGADALDELRRSVGDAPGRLTYWFAGTPVRVPGARLSFQSLGAQAMRDVTNEVVEGLRGVAAFRGLAYHDYVGLRALVEAP